MKTIHTLVQDIEDVVSGKGGWDATISAFFANRVMDTVNRRYVEEKSSKSGGLRMSSLGTPCSRKLWYNATGKGEVLPLPASSMLKFLYGDLLEDLLISLALAAGHNVEGCQDVMYIDGIKGHRDCVIDGVTVDVKSASTYSFRKFKENGLREEDPFGYLEQLSSYVYAAKDDPLVKDKKHGAFLVIDKQHGHLCLDMYDLSSLIDNKKEKVASLKEMVASSTPPARAYSDEPEGKSGNRKLGVACSYCDYKVECWPGVRTFMYSGPTGPKPVFLTKVNKEPRVLEV